LDTTTAQQTEDLRTFSNENGHFIEHFLISTRKNAANWFIRKETGHDNVKSFFKEGGRDFAILPELIQKPLSEGGGGHYKGSRQEILNAYRNASHGKLWKPLGPFYYNDGTGDYYYRAITKLSDSRAASALFEHGKTTIIPYAVSPHIFVNKGSDYDGWMDWEGAGVNLVIKGAYGPEAIVTKYCNGAEAVCSKALGASVTADSEERKQQDEQLAQIITSHISKAASTPYIMSDPKTVSYPNPTGPPAQVISKTDTNPSTNKGIENQNWTNHGDPNVKYIAGEGEKVTISKAELERLNKTSDEFTELQNERKSEILTELFKGKLSDDKELAAAVKEYAGNDMKTVRLLKSFYERISPGLMAQMKAKIKAEEKEQQEEQDEEQEGGSDTTEAGKKAKASKKGKEADRAGSIGCTAGKEPKTDITKFPPPNASNQDTREASAQESRNEIYQLRQKMFGRFIK
jgi:hypothetical protein